MQKIELVLELATQKASQALAAVRKSVSEVQPVDVFKKVEESAIRRPLAFLRDQMESAAKVDILQSLNNAKEKAQPLLDAMQSISAATGEFKALDTATAKIKTLGGDAKAIAGDLQNIALTMATEFPLSASEIQSATYNALSAGIKATEKDVGAFMDTAAKLAVGGSETIDNAVNILSSSMNAYGLEASETARVSDIFFKTVNLGKTSIPELNASLSNVIPTASAAGVSLENVGASLALMTANGIPTAQSTTKLNQLLLEIQKPGEKLAPILQKAGVSLESLRNEDLPANLERVKKALSEAGVEASQAFSSSEAGAAFNTLAKDIDALKGNLGEFQNAAGTTDAAYADMANTVENRTKQLQTQFDSLIASAIASGGEFSAFGIVAADAVGGILPQMNNLVAVTNGLPGVFSMASSAGKSAFSAISGVAGLAQEAVVRSIAATRASLLTMPPAKILVGNAARAMWAAITGPVGIAVAAIAAVTAGFVALYNYFPPFKQTVDDVIGFAVEKFEAFKNIVGGAVDAIAGFLGFGEAKEEAKKAVTEVATIGDEQRAEQARKDEEARKAKQADDIANAKATADRMLQEYQRDAPTLSDKVKSQRKKDLENFLDAQKGALLLSEKEYDNYYKKLEGLDKGSKSKSLKVTKDNLDEQRTAIEQFARQTQELMNKPVSLEFEVKQAQLQQASEVLKNTIGGIAGTAATIEIETRIAEEQLQFSLSRIEQEFRKAEAEAERSLAEQVQKRIITQSEADALLKKRRAALRSNADAEGNKISLENRRKLNEGILQIEEKAVIELAKKGGIEQAEAEKRLTSISEKRKQIAQEALSEAGVSESVIAQTLAKIDTLTQESVASIAEVNIRRQRQLEDIADSMIALEEMTGEQILQVQTDRFERETARRREELEKQMQVVLATEEQKNAILLSFEQKRAAEQKKIADVAKEGYLNSVADMVGQAGDLFRQQTVAFKGLAIAEALITTYLGATKALSRVEIFPLNIALAGIITAKGIANVAQIAGVGFRKGGYTGEGSPEQEAGLVHRKEFVFTHEVTSKNRAHFEEIHRRKMRLEDYVREKFIAREQITLPKEAKEMSYVYVRDDGKLVEAVRQNTAVVRAESKTTQQITRRAIAQFESRTKVDVNVHTDPIVVKAGRMY